MLNHRNTNIVFAVLMAVVLLLHFVWRTSLFWLVPLIVAYSLVLFYGSYVVSSNFFLPVICEAATNEKQIALTFDDGPAPETTPQVLALLKERGITATFFCIGKRIPGNEQLLQQIVSDGHLAANHSYSHSYYFDFYSGKKMQQDLEQMDAAMETAVTLKPRFFRPPYGVTTPPMKKALRHTGHLAIGWNIRSMDTVIKDEKKLFDKVVRQLKPGAIILFHDTCAITLTVLPRVINYATAQGYRFVRLDKLINEKAYA